MATKSDRGLWGGVNELSQCEHGHAVRFIAESLSDVHNVGDGPEATGEESQAILNGKVVFRRLVNGVDLGKR